MERFEKLVNTYLQDMLIGKADALDNLMKATNTHFTMVAYGRLFDKDKIEEVVSDTYLKISSICLLTHGISALRYFDYELFVYARFL